MLQQPIEHGMFIAEVVRHRPLCRDHFEITLSLSTFPAAVPGQFLQVLCRDSGGPERGCAQASAPSAQVDQAGEANSGRPLLRRPFSIGGLRRFGDRCELDLMGRAVGVGTTWLSVRRPGDRIDVLGPLGNGFAPPPGAPALLVAGGVGLPPIRWLGEALRASGTACEAIYGARTRDLLPLALLAEPLQTGEASLCVEEIARCGIPVRVATDDGTCGMRGPVTFAMEQRLDELAGGLPALHVYACGPEPMLRSVAQSCLKRRIPCQLAMERKMGCGMGTCQSCVLPINDSTRPAGWRYALCCTDGPVFRADQINWQQQAGSGG